MYHLRTGQCEAEDDGRAVAERRHLRWRTKKIAWTGRCDSHDSAG